VESSRLAPVTFAVGRALLWIALVAAVTGVLLLPFYRASAGAAYASVKAMQSSLPLSVLRGVHHWSSALLIIGGGAYLVLGTLGGSYRRPVHMVWVAAVAMVCLFLMFQLSGHLLPWDISAVRTAAIETGIAENMPFVGTAQARVLRGGSSVGPRTLLIWFVAHVALLPAVMIGTVWFLMRSAHGRVPRLARARLVYAAASVAILVTSLLAPAPLGAAATPADYASFAARPEWYVLPLHSLLTIAQSIDPRFAFVGTAVVPGLALAWLIVLPWLDCGSPVRSRTHALQGATIVGCVGFLGLCLMSAKEMAPIGSTNQPAALAATVEGQRVPILSAAEIADGKALFLTNGCAGCHTVAGTGGSVGPPLDGEGLRHSTLDWQLRHLKAPSGMVTGSTMPAYGSLKPLDLRSLATYLLSL